VNIAWWEAQPTTKNTGVEFKYAVPLVVIVTCLCHLGGLYLYTSGFFLTRYQVNNFTQCSQHLEFTGCYGSNFPKSFGRAVVLVIDALRFDFTLSHPPSDKTDPAIEDPPYRNKLPVIFDTLRKQPNHAFLFKFVADPPTTTMQVRSINTHKTLLLTGVP